MSVAVRTGLAGRAWHLCCGHVIDDASRHFLRKTTPPHWPQALLPTSVVGLATVLLFVSACSRFRGGNGAYSAADPQIRSTAAPDGAGPLIEVSGLRAGDLAALRQHALSEDEWSALLRVSVGDSTDEKSLPPMLGSYSVTDAAIRFRPMYPLDPGRPYHVIFDPSRLPASAGATPVSPRARRIETTITDRRAEVHASTRVVAVYPTAKVIPENQLRMYIYFSAPMGLAGAVDHVRLLDESDHVVEDAFLPMEVGLWNPDRTRDTLLFDPGRVKRGVLPNEQLGRAIRKGRKYTLIVDQDWLDARGRPLVESYRHEFLVGDPVEQPLDPSKWRLEPPAVGTRDPLVVSFPTPLDYALMQRALAVWSARGAVVQGQVHVEAAETRWTFVPTDAWREGEYQLVALPILEDPAGNRIGRPFELIPSDGPHRVEERPATLPFRVAPFPLRK